MADRHILYFHSHTLDEALPCSSTSYSKTPTKLLRKDSLTPLVEGVRKNNDPRKLISEQYFNRESQVDPVRGQLRGPAEFIDTVENLRIAFPDLHHQEEAIITQGDLVVSILNVTGTHTGNFFILPPTGNEISYEAVHLYRIGEDGKIVEHKAIRDDLTFLAQLGVIEPSAPEFAPFFQALTGTTNRTG